MLGVIAGYDELDTTTLDTPVSEYNRAFRMRMSKLRLGLPRIPFFDSLDPEIAKAVGGAVEVLRKLSASVGDAMLPSVPFEQIHTKVQSVEAYTYHSQWLAESPEKYQAVTRQRLIQRAADVTAPAYVEARRQLESLRRGVAKAFAAVDLLITPTLPSPPVTIAQGADPTVVSIRNTAPFDDLGLPAISVPCGFTTSGLPIGLQIVGAPFAESTVLALAHAYKQATEWHRRRPSV